MLDFSEIEAICIECERRSIKLIIDESFIHLSQCFDNFQDATHAYLLKKYKNLIIVKSLSKDFGIAGLRLGYILASETLITNTLKYGKLWNTNGIAEFFVDTLQQKDFIDKYEECRRSHISDTVELYNGINSIPQLKSIKPHTNFVLVDTGETDPNEFTTALLIKHGILVRSASDKIGLQGNYIRIATRRKEENSYIINAIKTLFAE